MKSLVIFYLLFICTFSIPNVFSYSSHKARLYNLLQKSLGTKASLFAAQNDEHASTPGSEHHINFVKGEHNFHTRENWDSGEDYYFLWANKNRRPVEYLAGRKRESNKGAIPPRASRINGGLWRSGLVG